MFVPEYAFTVTEHDPAKPWLVRGQEHQTVELGDGLNFFEWANDRWPPSRFTVQLDPWQLEP